MLGSMQRTLSGLIMKFANQYLDKIDSDLNLSLWSGDVVLKGVELRLDVLQRMLGYDQQLRIDYALIGKLQIRIPWTSITTKSVEITLSKMKIRLSIDRELSKPKEEPGTLPNLQDGAIDSDFIEIEGNSNESVNQGGESNSWTKSLLERIVANAVVNIEDLSLTLSSPDLGCLQISFASANVRPTNVEWEAVQIEPPSAPWRLTHYVISLCTLEVSLQDERSHGRPSYATRTVLRGLDLDIRIRMYRTPSVRVVRRTAISTPVPKSGPKLQADILALSPLEISLSAEQIQLLLAMSQSIQSTSTKHPVDLVAPATSRGMSIASDEPRSNSWGSWAWDLLAVPPDNNSVVDISEYMPSDTMILSIQAPSVIFHFYSISFMFATLHARHLSILAIKEISHQRLSISLQSLNFVDQSTLLPLLIITGDDDCKEFMPFLNIQLSATDLSDKFRQSLERHGFDTHFVPIRERVQDYSNSICLHSFADKDNQYNTIFIRSAAVLLNLKSSSSVVLFEQLFKFIPIEKPKKGSTSLVRKLNSTSGIVLGNFCLTLHIEDMPDWKEDELYSNLNSVSFHIAGLAAEYGAQTRRISCSSATVKMLSLALKAHMFREMVQPSTSSCFSVNELNCEMVPQTKRYSFSFKDMLATFCLHHIYLIVLSGAALADIIQYFCSVNELRLSLIGLRPTRTLCFFDAMFVNAVLSLKIIRLSASGSLPDAHKFTVMRVVIDISRRGQLRCLLSTEISAFLDIEISAKRDVSVNISPAKLVWDSVFCDFIRLFQIYRSTLPIKFKPNTSEPEDRESSDLKWKPSSLAVNISPVIIFVPLQDAYHIRRLPTVFGYRSSPSLSFHLPSVAISPLSMTLTDFSITDTNGNILLAPVSANAAVTSSLTQASIDVSRIIVSMDVNQANAFKLALVSLAPMSSKI